MNRWLATLAVWAVWGWMGLQPASAQLGQYTPPQTNPHPTVSPYLNMNRNNPAINYYGIVKPQINTAQTLQQLQNQIGAGTGSMVGLQDANNPNGNMNNFIITGHPVTFMSLQPYYPFPGQRFTGLGGIGTSQGGLGVGNMGYNNSGFGTPPGIFGPGTGSGLSIYSTQIPQGFRRER